MISPRQRLSGKDLSVIGQFIGGKKKSHLYTQIAHMITKSNTITGKLEGSGRNVTESKSVVPRQPTTITAAATAAPL